MQFLLLAYDAKDSGAPARRMATRDAHLESMARYRESGNMKMGEGFTYDPNSKDPRSVKVSKGQPIRSADAPAQSSTIPTEGVTPPDTQPEVRGDSPPN